MFLAMMVDEHVARALSKPGTDGVIPLPNAMAELESAAAEGFALWVVVDTGPDEHFRPTYTSMTAPEFFANYKIDEIPEFRRDWADVSKI